MASSSYYNEEMDQQLASLHISELLDYGTINIAFPVKRGLIFGTDSRFTSSTHHGHGKKLKYKKFHPKLFSTKCGNLSDMNALNNHLEALCEHKDSPSPDWLAQMAYAFIEKKKNQNVDFKVGTLIVGYDGRNPHIYKLNSTDFKPLENFKYDHVTIGSGSFAAEMVFRRKFRKINMDATEGVALAYEALLMASLRSPSCGGRLHVVLLTERGTKSTVCEPRTALRVYAEKFNHLSFNVGFGIYLLVRSNTPMDMSEIRHIYSANGYHGPVFTHCIGHTKFESGEKWTRGFHIYRIAYEREERAQEVFRNLVRIDNVGNRDRLDFGGLDVVWVKLSDQFPKALACRETIQTLMMLLGDQPPQLAN